MFLSVKQKEELLIRKCQEEVDTLLQWGCESVDMSYVLPNIEVEFSRKMRTTMGKAWTYFDKNGGKVAFCVKLFGRADEQERRNTILHELAHILANLQAGKRVGHDWRWKNMMRRLGCKPERCHTVNTEGIRRKNKRYVVKCARGCSITLTSSRRTRMMNRLRNSYSSYTCTRCGGAISYAALQSGVELRT